MDSLNFFKEEKHSDLRAGSLNDRARSLDDVSAREDNTSGVRVSESNVLHNRQKKYAAAFIETMILVGLFVATNLLLAPNDPGFVSLRLHPTIIIVAVIGTRYGFMPVMLASIITGTAYLSLVAILADVPSYLHVVSAPYSAPIGSMLVVAAIIGLFLEGHLIRTRAADRERDELWAENQKVLQSQAQLRDVNMEMAARIVESSATLPSLYRCAKELNVTDVETIYVGICRLLQEVVGAERVAVWAPDDAGCTRLRVGRGYESGEAPIDFSTSLDLITPYFNEGGVLASHLVSAEAQRSALPYLIGRLRTGVDGPVDSLVAVDTLPMEKYTKETIRNFEIVVDWASRSLGVARQQNGGNGAKSMRGEVSTESDVGGGLLSKRGVPKRPKGSKKTTIIGQGKQRKQKTPTRPSVGPPPLPSIKRNKNEKAGQTRRQLPPPVTPPKGPKSKKTLIGMTGQGFAEGTLPPPVHAPEGTQASRKILLIDSDMHFYGALSTELSPYGIEIHLADHDERSLELALELGVEAIVISVDVCTKRGFELCHKVKEWVSGGPLVVLRTQSTDWAGFNEHQKFRFHADAYLDGNDRSPEDLVKFFDSLLDLDSEQPTGHSVSIEFEGPGEHEATVDNMGVFHSLGNGRRGTSQDWDTATPNGATEKPFSGAGRYA